MSIINNVENFMKRYDYLIDKRERKYKQGKRLSEIEDEELERLRPNVFTSIMMMFELLHETVKTNQETRKSSKQIKSNQKGGATPQVISEPKPKKEIINAAAEAAATASAVAVLNMKNQTQAKPTDAADKPSASPDSEDEDEDEGESRRLSELEESLLPLLTKIIVYIEERKNAEKKKGDKEEDEEEKYPDIGTTAKNSAILVIRRIKKWWNDLISGGTSDLSSKINLKKAIPQLANNPTDMNNITAKAEELEKLAEKATDVIHKPLQKIERILSNDVRDIASSSVEGIMNALSLIPGIGTTLQLWRLLQNVIVIMSKSVTTMAGAKEQGSDLKKGVQGMKADFEKMGDPSALANSAAGAVAGAAEAAAGAAEGVAGVGANAAPALGNITGNAKNFLGAAEGALNSPGIGNLTNMTKAAGGLGAVAGAVGNAKDVNNMMKNFIGGSRDSIRNEPKTNHLRSIKKYRREYKQSLQDIRKTRKNILRIIKNMV